MSGTHYALYGNVTLVRTHCEDCHTDTIVIDGYTGCCDSTVDLSQITEYKRVCEPERRRHHPSAEAKALALRQQHDSCYYCGVRFGDYYFHNDVIYKATPVWDHLVPYIYSQNNNDYNFVASCGICNLTKSAKMFPTLQELQAYVQEKRKRKCIEILPSLQD